LALQAINFLEEMIVSKRLIHDNNPVLNYCAGNAVTKQNDAGDRKFSREASPGKIDGMVALVQAVGAGRMLKVRKRGTKWGQGQSAVVTQADLRDTGKGAS